MAEGKEAGRGSAGAGTLDRVREELEHYIEARVEVMLEGVGHRLGEGARRLGEGNLGPGGLATAVGKGGKMLREHIPTGSLLTATASHGKDALLDKAKGVTKDVTKGVTEGVTGKKPEKSTETGRGPIIIEDIDVGVPVREAYNQWTQFTEFSRFAKGVVDVDQQDDITTQWNVKVAKASRRWRGTITEQVPDQRIAWTTEGHKATTKGVVTFHPVAENLTKVLLVLYSPKGVVERVGSLWRAQGRRARLDLKLFRTFVMMRGEATGAWRGEIHEGEVVRTPEEVEEAEARAEEEGEEEEGEEEEGEEEEGEEEEPEDRYDEDEDEDQEDEEEDEDEVEDRDDASDEDDWEDDEDEPQDEEDEGREPDDRRDTRSTTP